jgi:RHS repeat-associated protein
MSAAYFPNGVPSSVSAFGSFPAVTYNVDGEGRPFSASGVVTSVAYDAGSRPTSIVYAQSGVSDTYQYDPNTGRMSSYQYTVGGASMTGALTWNPNGTLNQLAIADGFFSGGSQTCNYGYDELARLVTDNCGTKWSQTFSYDAFNNITKSGSQPFMPGYSQTNNRYQNGATYDSNGNLLYDTFNSYTWNVYNHPATLVTGNSSVTCGTTGTCLTYDAFNRVVETNLAGVFRPRYFGPIGKALTGDRRLPLPGIGTLDQTSATAGHLLRSDWLGTSRFATNLDGTKFYDRAFAPYGEIYLEELGGTSTPEVFTGDTQDTFAGLFDTPARELHPVQGRWISPDPAHSGVNAYAYSTNPLGMIDPSGLDPDPPLSVNPIFIGPDFPPNKTEDIPVCDPGADCGDAAQRDVQVQMAVGGINNGGANVPWGIDPGSKLLFVYEGESVWCGGECQAAEDMREFQQFQQDVRNSTLISWGEGLWGALTNFFGSENEGELPEEPNPYITFGTDAVGLVAPFAGKTGEVLGPAGALLSIRNDPNPTNVFLNVAPFLMEETAGAPLAFVGAEGDVLGVTAQHVLNGMIEAMPGERTVDGNGHTIPNPAFQEQNICQDLGCN